MGWDQSDTYESVQQFLARRCGLDLEKVISQAIAKAMEEKGLTVVSIEEVSPGGLKEDEPYYDFFGPDSRKKITLSDGSVFVHRVVSKVVSDDYGEDHYEFRRTDEEIKVKVESFGLD